MLAALALLLMTATATVPKPVLQLGHTHAARVVVWLPDGEHLVTATETELNLWDSRSGIIVDFIRMPRIGPQDEVSLVSASVAPDGNVMISGFVRSTLPDGHRRPDICRHYRFDVAKRSVEVVPETKVPETDVASADCESPDSSWATDDAAARVTAASRSHVAADGRRWEMVADGIRIDPARPGGRAVFLRNLPRDCFQHAYVAPDGQLIAYLDNHDPTGCYDTMVGAGTRIEVRSVVTGVLYPPLVVPGEYTRAEWLDDGRYVATALNAGCRGLVSANGLIVDAVSGRVTERFRSLRCMAPLGRDGTMLGVDGRGALEGLWLRRPGGDWQRLDVPTLEGRTIAHIAGSPDGKALIVSSALGGRTPDRLTLVRRPLLGRPLIGVDLPMPLAGARQSIGFSRESSRFIAVNDSNAIVWDVATGKQVGDVDLRSSEPGFVSADASTIIAGEPNDTVLNVFAIAPGGRLITTIPAGEFINSGLLPGRDTLWTAARDGTVRFYETTHWQRIVTMFRLPPEGYFAIDPAGRYDTNLGPDTRKLRWLMADRPWQSLPAQTFMREYYEPQLIARTLECVAADSCATVFPPLPPAGSLNRVLPEVSIGGVRPGASPGQVLVDIDVREGRDDGAANGKTMSGIRDLRLFRDNKLVGLITDTVAPGRRMLPVTLPTHRASVELTAYAFNTDRVKGETSPPVTYKPPVPLAPLQPRAYVIAIGVDRYAIPGKSLRFAAADAAAVTHALAAIPGYATTTMALTARADRNLATKADLRAILGILAGQDDAAFRQRLAASGIAAKGLQRATPDDVVILTFSGHGFADPRGHFYLLPSDAAAPDPANPAAMATLISSTELTEWLRDVDAGEMAIVIDACHSAASVASGGFKPGPMGDAGLGQLAFDKGIRILAATQADDVALEDADLGLGVLTHVIVREGLAQPARLDTLLDFAVGRLPGFARERSAARAAAAADRDKNDPPLLIPAEPPPPRAAKVQQPTLFDFTGHPSSVTLAAQASP